MGGRKKKGSKKKVKKEESNDDDSNSNNLIQHSNNSSSTHSNGSAEDPKSLDERASDSGEEEEIVDRKEEELEEEVVGVEALGNGSGRADLSVAEEDQIVKEVAVVEEDEKAVIEERGEVNESVGAQIDGDVEDLVEEIVGLAPGVVDSEELTTKNVDSQIEDEFLAAVEERKPEEVQDPVEVVASIEDEGIKTSSRGVVDDVKPLKTDDALVISTSPVVDNGKELETYNKPSEDQPLIGSNPLPVRRTSWMGCCGLFEVFSGGNR